MRNQCAPLLRNEISKALRRKLPYFGLFAVVVLSLVIYVAADQLSPAASANAWGYVAFSMLLVFNDIGLIFIIVFAALLLAEETGSGTIRAALAAPVARWELYLAKAITGFLYMLVLWTVALLVSVALAKLHYDFSAVTDPLGVVSNRATVFRIYLLGCVLSWVPLGALVMYGLFISTVVRSPGTAVAVGIGTIYLIDFTKHLVGLDPYIFTRYIGYSWQILQQVAQGVDYQWQPEIWRMLSLCIGCALLTFTTGAAIFQRQDLND
jgi:ABC-type transport system involved in multi-copper enzyme maturation permease subunit